VAIFPKKKKGKKIAALIRPAKRGTPSPSEREKENDNSLARSAGEG